MPFSDALGGPRMTRNCRSLWHAVSEYIVNYLGTVRGSAVCVAIRCRIPLVPLGMGDAGFFQTKKGARRGGLRRTQRGTSERGVPADADRAHRKCRECSHHSRCTAAVPGPVASSRLALRCGAGYERTMRSLAALSPPAIRQHGCCPVVKARRLRFSAGGDELGCERPDLVSDHARVRANFSDLCHWRHVRRRGGDQCLSPPEPSCISPLRELARGGSVLSPRHRDGDCVRSDDTGVCCRAVAGRVAPEPVLRRNNSIEMRTRRDEPPTAGRNRGTRGDGGCLASSSKA